MWVNNQLQIEIDNKTLKRDELDDGFRKTIDKNLLRYSTFDNIINLLRKGKPFILRVYDPKKEIKVHCLDKTPTMEKFWNDQKPNPYELFKLRNKAIHFCLSVSEEIAKAAFNLAKTNLEDLRKNWVTQSIASGVYEALQWDDLCEQCGINFLPRRRGNENE